MDIEKICDILKKEFVWVYCDTCAHEFNSAHCGECSKKMMEQINWELSDGAALDIALEIRDALEPKEEVEKQEEVTG